MFKGHHQYVGALLGRLVEPAVRGSEDVHATAQNITSNPELGSVGEPFDHLTTDSDLKSVTIV